MTEGLPNVLIVNDNNEKPEEIINDYLAIINNYKNDNEALISVLYQFFDDVQYWTLRQMFIDQAKMNLSYLEELDSMEHEFIEDDEDFEED